MIIEATFVFFFCCYYAVILVKNTYPSFKDQGGKF